MDSEDQCLRQFVDNFSKCVVAAAAVGGVLCIPSELYPEGNKFLLIFHRASSQFRGRENQGLEEQGQAGRQALKVHQSDA